MIIIYILAGIGGLCVLGVVILTIFIFLEGRTVGETDAEEPEITCVLTGEHCIFTVERSTCTGCPIAEEHENSRHKRLH